MDAATRSPERRPPAPEKCIPFTATDSPSCQLVVEPPNSASPRVSISEIGRARVDPACGDVVGTYRLTPTTPSAARIPLGLQLARKGAVGAERQGQRGRAPGNHAGGAPSGRRSAVSSRACAGRRSKSGPISGRTLHLARKCARRLASVAMCTSTPARSNTTTPPSADRGVAPRATTAGMPARPQRLHQQPVGFAPRRGPDSRASLRQQDAPLRPLPQPLTAHARRFRRERLDGRPLHAGRSRRAQARARNRSIPARVQSAHESFGRPARDAADSRS